MSDSNTVDLASLRAATFEPHVGEAFAMTYAQGDTTLRLLEVDLLSDHSQGAARRTPFSLVFAGPDEVALDQGIYRLEHPALGAIEVFLVPIAPARYEAVFN